jgi:hypothetical protein
MKKLLDGSSGVDRLCFEAIRIGHAGFIPIRLKEG